MWVKYGCVILSFNLCNIQYMFQSVQMFAFLKMFFLLPDQIAFELVRAQEVEEKVAGLNIHRIKVI